jgi:predicted AAA+ superfamily ATPase
MMKNTHDEILAAFSKVIVFHEGARRAYSLVQDAIEDTLNRGIPTSAMLYGVSGTGKSTLLEHFENIYGQTVYEVEDDGGSCLKPVIYFETPAEITIKGMARNMLIELGDPSPTGSAEQMTYKLTTLLRTAKTKVIFLDEIQRLVYQNQRGIRVKALQWLVSLGNKLKIAVILAGTEECAALSQYNKAFRRRYQTLIELREFIFSEAPDSDYLGTLRALDEAVHSISGLPSALRFHDPATAARLYIATRGNLEYLRSIMYKALKRRLKLSRDSGLTQEDFIAACEYMDLPKLSDINPFLVSLPDALNMIDKHRIDQLKLKKPSK